MYWKNFDKYKISLYSQVILYILAGINHFVSAKYYLLVMPPYFPFPLEIVYFTGFLEIIFGVGLYFLKTRNISIWLIMAFLLAILPAHWYVIQEGGKPMNIPLWIAIIRFPLQFALMYWAYSLRIRKVVA